MATANLIRRFLCLALPLLAGLHSYSLLAAPGDLNLQAQLIWGTNGEKPAGKDLKDLDVATLKKLRAVFKWKNYFEVDRQTFPVALSSKKRVRMSSKCEVEVQNLGDSSVEASLYGEGKLVIRSKQVLKPGEPLVLAGEDKNDTAWFVVLTSTRR
jgi:hypothetical protein